MDQRTPAPARPAEEAAGGDSPGIARQDCPCRRAFRLDPEHHDWLVSFEERGAPGVVELVRYLEDDMGAASTPDGHLPWLDFPDFVAMHNWRSPADVRDLAEIIDSALRERRHVPAAPPRIAPEVRTRYARAQDAREAPRAAAPPDKDYGELLAALKRRLATSPGARALVDELDEAVGRQPAVAQDQATSVGTRLARVEAEVAELAQEAAALAARPVAAAGNGGVEAIVAPETILARVQRLEELAGELEDQITAAVRMAAEMATSPRKSVQAERFEAVDRHGFVRAVFGRTHGHDGEVGTFGVRVLDTTGTMRAELGLDEDGPDLTLTNRYGSCTFMAHVGDDAGVTSLDVMDVHGYPVVRLEVSDDGRVEVSGLERAGAPA